MRLKRVSECTNPRLRTPSIPQSHNGEIRVFACSCPTLPLTAQWHMATNQLCKILLPICGTLAWSVGHQSQHTMIHLQPCATDASRVRVTPEPNGPEARFWQREQGKWPFVSLNIACHSN